MSLQDGAFVGSRSDHNRRNGRFVRGNHAYETRTRLRKQALAALYNFYYIDNPHDQLLAALCACHIVAAGKARSTVRRVAESNCAQKLLARLRPRNGAAAPRLRDFGL